MIGGHRQPVKECQSNPACDNLPWVLFQSLEQFPVRAPHHGKDTLAVGFQRVVDFPATEIQGFGAFQFIFDQAGQAIILTWMKQVIFVQAMLRVMLAW